MKEITFINPEFFGLLLLIPLFVVWHIFRGKRQEASVQMPDTSFFTGVISWRVRLHWVLFALKLLAFTTLVVALARPQSSSHSTQTKSTEGIDIVLSIDVSSSMLAKDLNPNRLVALKRVAAQFIKDRPNDRIGIVVYSGESFTKVPVTSDKSVVLQSLSEVDYGQIENGTAIGMGLATAVNRLKDSKAKSKVVILMTDGVNNMGFIDPETAANLAKEYGIRVYTVGIGSNTEALSPVSQNPDGSFRYIMEKVEIDEKLLKEIAKITGGKYFRATNNQKLEQIYKEIDKMEKTKTEELHFYQYQEKFRFWAICAAIFLLLEFILRNTVFRNFA